MNTKFDGYMALVNLSHGSSGNNYVATVALDRDPGERGWICAVQTNRDGHDWARSSPLPEFTGETSTYTYRTPTNYIIVSVPTRVKWHHEGAIPVTISTQHPNQPGSGSQSPTQHRPIQSRASRSEQMELMTEKLQERYLRIRKF